MGTVKEILNKLFEAYCKMFGGGKDYWKNNLGLDEGEYPVKTFNGFYDIDVSSAKQIGGALLGMGFRGKAIMAGITNKNRFAVAEIEEIENDPLVFDKANMPKIEETPGRKLDGKLNSQKGMEKAISITITTDDEQIRIAMPESYANDIFEWAKS